MGDGEYVATVVKRVRRARSTAIGHAQLRRQRRRRVHVLEHVLDERVVRTRHERAKRAEVAHRLVEAVVEVRCC